MIIIAHNRKGISRLNKLLDSKAPIVCSERMVEYMGKVGYVFNEKYLVVASLFEELKRSNLER